MSNDHLRLTIERKKKAVKKGQLQIVGKKAAADDDNESSNKRTGKGAAFEANMLAFIRADHLWEHGANESEDDPRNKLRPVMAWFHGTPVALQTFMMNLRLGHFAVGFSRSNRWGNSNKIMFEWLKSGQQIMTAQQISQTDKVTQMYVPNICNIHDGLVAADQPIKALAVTPSWWIDKNLPKLRPSDHDDIAVGIKLFEAEVDHPPVLSMEQHQRFALVAMRTLAYLDKRISKPLLTSIGYRYYLFLMGLKHTQWSLPRYWASESTAAKSDLYAPFRYKPHSEYRGHHFDMHGLWSVGVEHAVGINASQESVATLLAHTTNMWMLAKGELEA